MFRAKLTVAITLFLIIAGTLASLLISTPQGVDSATFHTYFALAYISAVAYIGSSILFFMGFDGFKARLRHAYTLICVGTSLLGLSMLELPALLSVNLLETMTQNYGYIVALPFIGSIVVLLVGTTKLARLFGVRGLVVTWWFPLICIVGSAALMFVIPHAPAAVSEANFKGSMAGAAVCLAILTFNLIHILKAKSVAGVTYTPALAWMSIAVVGMVATALGGVLSRVFLGTETDHAVTAFTLIPLAPSGLLTLVAAYHFNLITSEAASGGFVVRNFFGKPIEASRGGSVSSVDIVIYAAQLVSNPHDVDSVLDQVRIVTSRLTPGGKPGSEHNPPLQKAYLELEEYLTTKEPVREFTVEGLRQEIANSLHLDASSESFWSKLPVNKPGSDIAPA